MARRGRHSHNRRMWARARRPVQTDDIGLPDSPGGDPESLADALEAQLSARDRVRVKSRPGRL